MQIGHNSGLSQERLKSFIDRIEKIEESREEIQNDLRDIYQEAKSTGFDATTIRALIKTRKSIRKNAQKHKEQQELFDLYAGSIGMEA